MDISDRRKSVATFYLIIYCIFLHKLNESLHELINFYREIYDPRKVRFPRENREIPKIIIFRKNNKIRSNFQWFDKSSIKRMPLLLNRRRPMNNSDEI